MNEEAIQIIRNMVAGTEAQLLKADTPITVYRFQGAILFGRQLLERLAPEQDTEPPNIE
jgi:hypothetical protein